MPFDGSDDEDEPREPKCNRCGSTDVRWRQQGGKWTLFSLQPGVLHVCELKTDEFPNLE
jgi:hypothetical protein